MSIRQRPSQLIDLRKACPTRRLLPAASIAYASRAILTDPFSYADALLHGPDLGSAPLREEVAAWLSEFYRPDAGPIPPERLCITGGASQNLACILQKFTDPVYTRAVWLVAPTLRISCKIFEDNGLEGKLKVVLEDEEGLDIDTLETLLAAEEEKAISSVNIKPVCFRISRIGRKITKLLVGLQIELQLPKNIQTHHLLYAHIQKPNFKMYFFGSPQATCRAGQKIRCPRYRRRRVRLSEMGSRIREHQTNPPNFRY